MSGIQKQQQSKQTQAKSNAPKAPEQVTQNVNLEQLMEAPETMRPDQILAAQKQVGNQVVQRALDGQKKREAMTDEQGYLKGEINNAIQSKRGGGSSLPDPVREVASKNLKHDFSDVRIHTDEKANELSQSINARAFTIGKDIFFKKGVFAPGSKQGRETIMHELTHVVQQSGSSGASGRLKLGAPDTSYEKQADQVGKANSSVDPVSSASNSAVQRIPSVGGRLAPIEEEPAVGGQNIADKAPNVGGNPAPVPEEDPVINQAKANRPQGVLNTEIRGFDKSKLKSVPVAEKAPNVGGRLNPIQEAPDVGGNKDDDEVQLQRDPIVQREMLEEDELQMQRDTVVQREEMPEEELQMQRDPVVQREEMPEEELQMQRDTSVVQREEMPEEELQAQPDVGGLVQRIGGKDDEDDWDTDSDNQKEEAPHITREQMSEMGGQLVAGLKKGQARSQKNRAMSGIKTFDQSRLKSTVTKDKSAPNLTMSDQEKQDFTRKTKDAGLMSGRSLRKVQDSEKSYRDGPNKAMSPDEQQVFGNKVKKGNLIQTVNSSKKSDDEKKGAQAELKTSRREELMNLIKDPKTDPEKVKEAQEELKSLHKRGNALTGLFKKSYASQAMGERGKTQKEEKKAKIAEMEKEVATLQQKAEGGQSPEAFKAWKEKKEELAKLKGQSKTQKVGSVLLGGAKSFISSSAGTKELKEQFLGKKEEKKEAAAPAGGGGAGIANLLEEKIAENQKLKAENEELKAKVAN